MRQCPSCSTVHDNSLELCPHDGETLSPPDPLLGVTLDGKYRVEVLLGHGGMGAVYRATHVVLDRTVAIKIIRGDFLSSTDREERFRREALAVARLKHAHVVTLYDYSVSPEHGTYIVMEYVNGRALSGEIRRRGRLPAAAAIDLARQICSAVQSAHAAGIVHRDLKPANVVLEITPGGAVMAKVLDFGIALIQQLDDLVPDRTGESGADATIDGIPIGTPLYMSPEQCAGEPADARSDIYAIGCVLYEMLVGEPPFVSDRMHVLLYRHALVEPTPPSERGVPIHPDVDAAILRALAKRPEDRYESADSFAQALGTVRSLVEADASFPPVMGAGSDLLPGPLSSGPLATPRPLAARMYETRASVPNNLPHEATSFVGREDDIDAICELLQTHRFVTLLGPGGIGKTRLSLQVASRSMPEREDGVWFIDLAAIIDGSLVAKAVAAAASVAEVHGRPLVESLASHFSTRSSLVVLDNCEHLTEPCADLVETLLERCPTLGILVTSQAVLGVSGETVHRVRALGLPVATRPNEARDSEAVRLFIDRARQQNAALSLTDDNAAAIARICERLDGIPLAIELAAARMRVLSIDQILARLDDRFRLLTGGARRGGGRQQTLRATLDWSYGLLGEEERALFARLGVFAGSWTLEAAEAVCSGGTLDKWAILDILTALVDRSLVIADPVGSGIRYRMLESIRQYALELFDQLPDATALRDSHRAYFVEMARRAEPELTGPRMDRWMDRFEREHENFRLALAWSATSPEPARAILEVASPLYRFWHHRGYLSEAHGWLTRGLDEDGDVPEALRARSQTSVGSLELIFGNYQQARALEEEGLVVLRRLGDRMGIATTLNSLGGVAYYLADYEEALERYEECAATFREIGDVPNLANVLNNLGMIVRIRGDRDRAQALYEEALALGRRLGFRQAVARSLMSMGVLATERREMSVAVGLFEEAVELFGELGDRRMTASARNSLGDALRFVGDLKRAGEQLRAALGAHFEIGDQPNAVFSLASFASLAMDEGNPVRALRLAGAFLALGGGLGLVQNPFEREDFEMHLESARAALGERAAAEEAAGARMTLGEAVTYAREES